MPPKTGRSSKVPSAARDEVVPMTTPLFALGTKDPKNTARDLERLLEDRLVLIRHGERLDHADKAWRGTALLPLFDPPLSNTGRKQSFETALQYFALQQEKRVEERVQGMFSALLVSPFHRCLETALIINIVAFEGSLAMFVDPQLSDWQQQKVFRTAPVLGGRYHVTEGGGRGAARGSARARARNGDDGDDRRLVFQPQLEALRTALEPFFQQRVSELDTIDTAFKVTPDVAQRWVENLEVWLQHHSTLEVWTSAEAERSIKARVAQAATDKEAEDTHVGTPLAAGGGKGDRKCSESRGKGLGLGSDISSSGGASAKAAVNARNPKEGVDGRGSSAASQCGVPHPETKSDLARRCQQVEQSHFLFSEAAMRQLPDRVTAAVLREQRERLPKYFQTSDARPAESREKAGPPALLPPMHFMVVTHADVVAGLVEAFCPKHFGDASGKSVPYCSVSVLRRHNNYYRIPPPEERATAGGSGGGAGGGRGRCANQRGASAGAFAASSSVLAKRRAASDEMGVSWEVDLIGSTDQLITTRIVLQFS